MRADCWCGRVRDGGRVRKERQDLWARAYSHEALFLLPSVDIVGWAWRSSFPLRLGVGFHDFCDSGSVRDGLPRQGCMKYRSTGSDFKAAFCLGSGSQGRSFPTAHNQRRLVVGGEKKWRLSSRFRWNKAGVGFDSMPWAPKCNVGGACTSVVYWWLLAWHLQHANPRTAASALG